MCDSIQETVLLYHSNAKLIPVNQTFQILDRLYTYFSLPKNKKTLDIKLGLGVIINITEIKKYSIANFNF